MGCTTDTDRQERIAWLAALSAARRTLRAAGWSAQEAIDAQLNTRRPVRFSVWAEAVYRRAELVVLFMLQDGQCYLCDEAMRARGVRQSPDDATRDHVVPRRRLGSDQHNLLAAHRRCNEAKADRPPYPCELLYLEAINARRNTPPRPVRVRPGDDPMRGA